MQSTQFILAGALRGAGDTRWPLYSTAIGIWGIRVVLVHVFIAMGMGLMGAWVAQLCDQAFRAVFIYSRYKSGAWKQYAGMERQRQQRTLPQEITLIKCY